MVLRSVALLKLPPIYLLAPYSVLNPPIKLPQIFQALSQYKTLKVHFPETQAQQRLLSTRNSLTITAAPPIVEIGYSAVWGGSQLDDTLTWNLDQEEGNSHATPKGRSTD
jgi:hypothetical protein